jgi:MFS family permease
LFEIGAMALALFGFYTHNVGLLLTVLFFMGVHSATFGPIKYAILPQALRHDELLGGNALVETGTQLAMLLGLIVGSALIEVGSNGTLWAGTVTLTMAVVGYLASRQIPPAPATAPGLTLNWNPFTETARVLAITCSDRAVFHAVLGISWYWFYATVLIAQLPNYTRLNLGGDGSVAVLVLTLFSIGTGVGALLCERLSARRVEIGLVPLGALGLAVFGIDLYFARPGLAMQPGVDWLGFVHGAGSLRIALDLALIGMFAGVYVVPLFAFIQRRTPADRLSRVIAGNNIINAVLICMGAGFGLGMDALGLGVPQSFLLAAVLGVLFVGFIFVRVPEFVARFAVWARFDRRRT